MNPNINLIPSAHLVKQQYLLWNPVDETWSDPVDFATAQETAARTPGLQACVLMPDGTTSTPAPFTEIYKRAHPSKPNQPEPTLAKKIKDLLNEPLPGLLDPLPGTTPPKPSATPAAPRPSTPAAPIPPETLALLRHALRLFLCATYGTLYLTAAGAVIGGLRSQADHITISGLILGLITAVVHATLSSRAD